MSSIIGLTSLIQQEFKKFKRIVNPLLEKYVKDESDENENETTENENETTKWWQDKNSRQEILKQINCDYVQELERAFASVMPDNVSKVFQTKLSEFVINFDKTLAPEDEELFDKAAKTYLQIMLYNWVFDKQGLNDTLKEVVADFSLHGQEPNFEISRNNLEGYAQKISDLTTTLAQLGLTEKQEVEKFLPVLRAKSLTLPDIEDGLSIIADHLKTDLKHFACDVYAFNVMDKKFDKETIVDKNLDKIK